MSRVSCRVQFRDHVNIDSNSDIAVKDWKRVALTYNYKGASKAY